MLGVNRINGLESFRKTQGPVVLLVPTKLARRRVEAPADTLQAVGGWSQPKTGDSYGEPNDPDLQFKIIRKISFPGLHSNSK